MALNRYVLLIVFYLTPISLFSNKLYFPQVAFGGGYTTTIVLMNTGAGDVSSDFQVYTQTGALLRSVPTIVPGEGSTRFSITDPETSITSTWGMLDAGTGTVQGVATFELQSASGALITTAGVLGLEAAKSFILPVDVRGSGIASNTGVAIANVTDNAVTIVLQLISETGSGSPSVTGNYARSILLRSRNQLAEFVTSFWPQLAVGFRGTLVVAILATGPASLSNSVAVTGLAVRHGLLSALPAIAGTISCKGCWDY